MKFTVVFVLLAVSLSIYSQTGQGQQTATNPLTQFEKGDISEIKTKRRVYVDADSPGQSENIIKSLKKDQGLEVVDALADAEFIIAYKVEREKSKIHIGVAGAPPPTDWVAFGQMSAYVPQTSGRHRLVWENRMRYQEPPPYPGVPKGWEQPLEKSMIGKFLKALKKMRGEK